MIELAGDAQRNREIGGTHHDDIQALDREQFVGALDGRVALSNWTTATVLRLRCSMISPKLRDFVADHGGVDP